MRWVGDAEGSLTEPKETKHLSKWVLLSYPKIIFTSEENEAQLVRDKAELKTRPRRPSFQNEGQKAVSQSLGCC